MQIYSKPCDCGCNRTIPENFWGRRRRFATNACRQRAYRWRIIGKTTSPAIANELKSLRTFRNAGSSLFAAEPANKK